MTVRVAQIMLSIVVIAISCLAMLVAEDIAWDVSAWTYSNEALFSALVGFGVQTITLPFIWLPTIKWNALRIFATILAPPVAALLASTICLALHFFLYPYDKQEIALWIAVVLALALQPTLFILIWTDWSRDGFRANPGAASTSQPRAILCPKCSYDLSASHHTRCPECANERTLSEVLADATAPDPLDQSPKQPKT